MGVLTESLHEERDAKKELEGGDIETGPTASQISEEVPAQNQRWVTWDGPNDPDMAKNWPLRKRWLATMILSGFAFLHPLSETMVAPSNNVIASELHIHQQFAVMTFLSIFLVGIGLGPLILGPLSEIYGRKPVLLFGNAFYVVWNTACGFAETGAQLIAFRVLSGFGAAAALAVGGGVIGDLWRAEERGTAMAAYVFAPLLGPALGPIAGGFITGAASWRWVFWTFSMASVVLFLIAFLFFHETYEPVLLHRRAARIRKERNDPKLYIENDPSGLSFFQLLRSALARPVRMIGTQIIVQILAVLMAILYGAMFLFLFTYPSLWTSRYHQSVGTGSLNYISTGIGFAAGAQIAGRLSDHVYVRLKARNGDTGKPEFRAPVLVPGVFLVPIGLLWYGWSGEACVHWMVPNLGALVYCTGCILCYSTVQLYVIDAYSRYAASALSSINILRSLAGFGFPLFAPYMFDALGYGWGSSILALAAAMAGTASTVILWWFGETLRKKSPYAAG